MDALSPPLPVPTEEQECHDSVPAAHTSTEDQSVEVQTPPGTEEGFAPGLPSLLRWT